MVQIHRSCIWQLRTLIVSPIHSHTHAPSREYVQPSRLCVRRIFDIFSHVWDAGVAGATSTKNTCAHACCAAGIYWSNVADTAYHTLYLRIANNYAPPFCATRLTYVYIVLANGYDVRFCFPHSMHATQCELCRFQSVSRLFTDNRHTFANCSIASDEMEES